jgi:hypothetical protein
MKKLKSLKIRKVWVIKPKSRIQTASKRTILAKVRKRELEERKDEETVNE